MRKVNYIASAGTGKTYKLVEEVYNNYLLKGININELFISTFTEKSAGELRNRIISKLKNELYHGSNIKKENIFENIYKIQDSYIGTIHSLFLRILKNYSDKTFVNQNTKVLNNYEFDIYFDKSFETYLLNNQDNIDKISKFIQDKKILKNILKKFYQKRIRILNKNVNYDDIQKKEEEIKNLKNETILLLNDFINIYYKELIELREEKIFKKDLLRIRDLIEIYKIIEIPSFNFNEINKTFPRLLAQKNISNNAKTIINRIKKEYSDLNIKENLLIDKIVLLKDKVLNLNYLIILNEFKKLDKILENLKIENNFIDNDDILIRTLNLLKSNKEIKEKIQNKFKAIIVDEFQDTDNIQLEVFKILSEKSDFIVLGDPKQCIYEWRNANLDDYIEFISNNNFENKNLNICYRSNKNLVEFYNYIFSNENSDFLSSLRKKNANYTYKLIADNKAEDENIEIIFTNNEEHVILNKIKELIEKNNYKYGDILILFRKNKSAQKLVDVLKNNSIPFISYLENQFNNTIEIISVLNLIKLIKYPFDELNLLSVLKSPIFCYSDLDLYNLRNKLDIYSIPEFQKIKNVIENIENYSIHKLIKILYKEFKIVEKFSLYPDYRQKVENLKKLVKLSSNFDRNNFQLRDFIQFLENTDENVENIIIEDESFIKLMSIHKAKGLEAKVVIIPYIFEVDNTNTEGFYNIDGLMVKIDNKIKIDNKKRNVVKSENFKEDIVKQKNIDAEERLLYVALTRAKEKLIILANNGKNIKTDLQKKVSKLIKDIEENNNRYFKAKIQYLDKIYTENSNYWSNKLFSSKDNNLEEEFKLLKNKEEERTNDYNTYINIKKIISVSQLMELDKLKNEDDYELIYYEDKDEKNYSSNLGTLVHKILEGFSFITNKDLAKEEIIKKLQEYQNLYSNKIIKEAEEILFNFLNSKYYNEISNSQILFRELPFTLKEENKYIEGIIDLVYEKDDKLIIMDYKTNKITNTEKLEHIYKVQKKYYTKAIELIFPEKGKNIEFKFCWLRELN
ncbi:MAG: RecBCD enzyme subunit RecB [Candidatus Sericytochromatia bacterium]|nr:MAG: RecBCD enzyme subunit RecB [Candidatus Sericytochromatia bacterium]